MFHSCGNQSCYVFIRCSIPYIYILPSFTFECNLIYHDRKINLTYTLFQYIKIMTFITISSLDGTCSIKFNFESDKSFIKFRYYQHLIWEWTQFSWLRKLIWACIIVGFSTSNWKNLIRRNIDTTKNKIRCCAWI